MAAREIKTTLAVDGEQAFKRSINEAKTSIRNLGTQLTLAQAEFKKDGDAMKLMQSRAKALKAEIQQQKEIVRALEGAVKDATKKYGESSTECEKWEAELNRAKAAMANLESELANNENGLDRNGKAFQDAGDKAGEFSDAVSGIAKGVSFELITSGIGKISSSFDTAISKAVELATKMWNMMRDAASWADDEITLAKVYGISTDELQQMQYAAKLVDTDVDTIISARQRLQTAMSKELDSKDIQEAFQALRVPVYDQNTGKPREWENVFWDAGAALMAMDDEVQQNAIAMKLFGRSWRELIPLFSTGRAGYEQIMSEATVVPEENLQKLGALQDQLDKLDTEFQALKMNVLSDLAPAFEVLASTLTDLFAEFNAYLQTEEGQQMMAELRQAVTDFFSEVKNIDLKEAVNTVSGALGTIKDVFNWISEHKDAVVTALEAIGIAWAGIKVTELATNIGKIVSGFRTLWNGADKKLPTLDGVGGSGTGTGTGTGGQTGTQNTATENVTTQNTTTQSVTTQNVTSGNTTTENVQTMYVQNMIGGNGTGGNPSVPSTGNGGNGFNGYVPILYPGNGNLGLGSGNNTFNLGGGDNTLNLGNGDTTLGLPSGGDNAIELGPNDFSIDGNPGGLETGSDGGGGGFGGLLYSFLSSPVAKAIGGACAFLWAMMPNNPLFPQSGSSEDDAEYIESFRQARMSTLHDRYNVGLTDIMDDEELMNMIFGVLNLTDEKLFEWLESERGWKPYEEPKSDLEDRPTVYVETDPNAPIIHKNRRTGEVLSVEYRQFTDDMIAATEKFWDAFRDDGDFTDEDWDEFEAAFKGSDKLWDLVNDHMDSLLTSYEDDSWRDLTDLPADFWRDLMETVNPDLYSTPAGAGTDTGAQLTKTDIEAFGKVPGEMEKGVAKAVNGIQVQMDRVTVGRLVAPVVSQIIAQETT